jgi:hypothetical protein
MKRIVSALVASLALLAFAAPSFAATPTSAPKSSSMSSSSMSSMKSSTMAKPITCPKGQTAVKGYTKKDGTVVKPYCRKSS